MVSKEVSKENFLIPIQELLLKVEEKIRAQVENDQPDLSAALNHLISSGGKRIRPAVALLTGGMLHGEEEALIILASAIELLHTATLVHDDLIDGSLLRRGIATINSQWSPAATVLTGDFIFAKAAKLAAETNSIEVMKLFANTLAIIVNGEITQLFRNQGNFDRQDYLNRIYAKTASMFELASGAAAFLSPVSNLMVQKMLSYGYHIGMAFQIMDDVLDFTGNETTVGKPIGSDLRQGLITLPVIIYQEDHPGDDQLKKILTGKDYSDENIVNIVDKIKISSAIEKSIQEAKDYINKSLSILEEMPSSEKRQSLESLANYIIYRQL